MRLSIVILSYNRDQLVIDCVNSLINLYKNEITEKKIEIIIVDNASEEIIYKKIVKELGNKNGVKIIKSNENLGFGRGCNLGEENSNGKYVLFLNSDTEVLSKGFIEMTDYLEEHKKVAIIGGKLFNDDGTPQKSAGKFYNLLNFFIMLLGGERLGMLRFSPKKIQRVDWVSGACLMVNKDYFNIIGRFDKDIFMYVEDMELSYRAKSKGYQTYFYSDLNVKHKEHGSSNRGFAVVNIYKGILHFYKQHKNKLEYEIVRLSLFIKAMIIYILGRITNNSYYIKTYGEAIKVIKG